MERTTRKSLRISVVIRRSAGRFPPPPSPSAHHAPLLLLLLLSPLQACEHLGPAPTPDPGDGWSLYLLGAQRSQKLQMTEGTAAFSPEISPDAEFHSTFVHTLRDDLSPEGVARTESSHFLFVETVQSLLCATRLLNYC